MNEQILIENVNGKWYTINSDNTLTEEVYLGLKKWITNGRNIFYLQDSILYSYLDTSIIPIASESNISSDKEIVEVACYPNPFNPTTLINTRLQNSEHLNVTVLNAKGENIAVIADNIYPKGNHCFYWDARTNGGKTIAAGNYLIKICTRNRVYSKKIVLAK